MKQNERILVYLVTGFLAVILVAAVFFGQDGKGDKSGARPAGHSLAELMNDKSPAAEAAKVPAAGPEQPAEGPNGAGAGNGQGTPTDASGPRSPLVAQPPAAATDLLAQLLGASRRDRTVRIVRARDGDSLEALVRRWCGARDPFLEEAFALNEGMRVLRPGDEIALPWVEDEVVLTAYQARQPKLGGTSQPAATLPATQPGTQPGEVPAPDNTPAFRMPKTGTGGSAEDRGAAAATAGTQTYTVKDKDSLWKIAASLQGKNNADKVIAEIRKLNPGLSDTLHPGQKITVPADK